MNANIEYPATIFGNSIGNPQVFLKKSWNVCGRNNATWNDWKERERKFLEILTNQDEEI